MEEPRLAHRILAAVKHAENAFEAGAHGDAEETQRAKEAKMIAAIQQTLASELGLAELRRSLSELTMNLESATPFQRADIRAAAARALKVMASLRS
jgi:hypothetical protein